MSTQPSPYPDIRDLAIIGNCRTAAILDRDGGVVWFCAPRFDSPSLFASLLDHRKGGVFRVAPTAGSEVSRRYIGPTPILETTFHAEGGGILRLTDLMPVVRDEDRDRRPWPQHQILRKIECVEGEVEVEVIFDPRPDYGRRDPGLEAHGHLGIWCQNSAEVVTLAGEPRLEIGEEGHSARARSTLRTGETRWLSMTYAEGEPAVFLDPRETGQELLDVTRGWWEDWTGRCRYDGPWKDEVVRSAITLKLLSYAPSGAVVAAVTTSLPESESGSRNWDYRYCWLRDASWTLRALFGLGYGEEARAFYDWILYATRLTAPDVQVLYDLHGKTDLEEEQLDHLEGWRSVGPVRIGNDAHHHLQLDVYGATLVAAFEYVDNGGTLDSAEQAFLVGLAKAVCRRWTERDRGIWEIRGEPKHFTYSKVMCWAALDRILKLHERGDLDEKIDVPVEYFRENRNAIRERVEAEAFWPQKDCYRGAFEENLVDAALLRLPATGYVHAADERMVATRRHLAETLRASDDGTLLYRYVEDFDGLQGREGAFDLVSFWLIECLALAGEIADAEVLLDGMCGRSNDIGLYSEETDPETGDFLGNFPQAFTHIGLINAVLTLEAERGEREPTVETPWEHQHAPAGEEARHGGPRPYERQKVARDEEPV